MLTGSSNMGRIWPNKVMKQACLQTTDDTDSVWYLNRQELCWNDTNLNGKTVSEFKELGVLVQSHKETHYKYSDQVSI